MGKNGNAAIGFASAEETQSAIMLLNGAQVGDAIIQAGPWEQKNSTRWRQLEASSVDRESFRENIGLEATVPEAKLGSGTELGQQQGQGQGKRQIQTIQDRQV